MTTPRILIACIGNIFLGDDGFGSEVARRLAQHDLPPDVVLKDFGIRSLDLTYALLDPYELVILVDACNRGGMPGTVYLIETDISDCGAPTPLETHNMNPANVLRMAMSMGGTSARVVVVGCEPARTGSDEEGLMGLSDPVEAAIDEAIAMIEGLIKPPNIDGANLEKGDAMSNELTQFTDGHEARHTLYLLGGAAILVFGAGVILASPVARRFLGDGIGNILGAGIPHDIARYMRMRSM